MNDKCALVGHMRLIGYSDCCSDASLCKGCNRIICEYHKTWMEGTRVCNECIANDVSIIIGDYAWTASVGVPSEYIEFYKRLYCLHTKSATKAKS